MPIPSNLSALPRRCWPASAGHSGAGDVPAKSDACHWRDRIFQGADLFESMMDSAGVPHLQIAEPWQPLKSNTSRSLHLKWAVFRSWWQTLSLPVM